MVKLSDAQLRADLGKLEVFSSDTKPVVLMFRPTHYVIVPKEKLQAWEDILRNEVGVVRPETTKNTFETICMCGGEGHGYDDSDWLEN